MRVRVAEKRAGLSDEGRLRVTVQCSATRLRRNVGGIALLFFFLTL